MIHTPMPTQSRMDMQKNMKDIQRRTSSRDPSPQPSVHSQRTNYSQQWKDSDGFSKGKQSHGQRFNNP